MIPQAGGKMRRSGTVKFQNSVNLFKFVHKVLVDQKGAKINDQDVGNILEYNPSDCSHWKRGEKSVKSVFALNRIAEVLNVEPALIFDIASGSIGVDEGWFEYQESRAIQSTLRTLSGISNERIQLVKERAIAFAAQLLKQADFKAAPLYVPEVVRFFAFISLQPADLIDRMSRILRVKAGQYVIQFPKGDLKPQTRLAMVKELVRIVCEGERERFPEIGERDQELLEFEELVIATNLLIPYGMLKAEMSKIDIKKNIVNELAATFWIPKTLVSLQLSQLLTSGERIDSIRRTPGESILSR
jgi:hypothetical protein